MIGGADDVRRPDRSYPTRDLGRCPRVNDAVTTEPRTEPRAEPRRTGPVYPSQAWGHPGPSPAGARGTLVLPRGLRHQGVPRAVDRAGALLCGDQFAQVAIAILVYRRTHSLFLTALAYALTYLPPIAGGPLLSGLADLFPRRRVMIACDVLRVGTVGLMAVPGMPLPRRSAWGGSARRRRGLRCGPSSPPRSSGTRLRPLWCERAVLAAAAGSCGIPALAVPGVQAIGGSARRGPGWPGRRDRGHHARHELDAPARRR